MSKSNIWKILFNFKLFISFVYIFSLKSTNISTLQRTNMINKGLNYGRQHIRFFTSSVAAPRIIVDLGAGSGTDPLLARENHPSARPTNVESYESNIQTILCGDNIPVFKTTLLTSEDTQKRIHTDSECRAGKPL